MQEKKNDHGEEETGAGKEAVECVQVNSLKLLLKLEESRYL